MGNKLGWIIAGAFAAFVVTLLVVYLAFPSSSDPTGLTTRRGRLSFQKPRADVVLVLGSAPAAEGNAGEDYRRGIERFEGGAETIRALIARSPGDPDGSRRLSPEGLGLCKPIADAVAAGAARKKMEYCFKVFPSPAPKKFKIPFWPPEQAGRFQDLMEVLLRMAEHHAAAGDLPKAERAARDAFTIGWHLMNERARLGLVLTGVGIQETAGDWLIYIYGEWKKPARAAQVREYMNGLGLLKGVYRVLDGSVIRKVRPKPGDVFNLAENHADRAVRVEAIIALGIVKNAALSRGDRRHVARLIRRKLASEDPLERAAAVSADELDADGINRLTHPQTWE